MHTSYPSHTSHTFHKPHTSHKFHKSHVSSTSTHHSSLSPITPAFAVATLPCLLDSELHALESNSEVAIFFCPAYLESRSQTPISHFLSRFKRAEIKSACSCFDDAHRMAPTTTPTARTEADFALTATALPPNTIVSTSHAPKSSSGPSTSTAGGSAVQGNRRSSASRGRFAVIVVSMLVIVPVVMSLNGL